MPERSMPVIVRCSPKGRDGFTLLSGPSSLSVRRVPREALKIFLEDKRRADFERQYGVVPEREREGLLYLLGLADAIRRRNRRSLRAAVEAFVPDQEWLSRVWEEIARSPLGELQKKLNSVLASTSFVVWWTEREGKLVPGIYCESASSALSTLALTVIGQPGGLGVCKRPQCRKPFLRLRSAPKQDYCSSSCRVAAGMVRYRVRKKRKARKSGR